ncbi:hypothetical protein BVG19_g361 [[Candida] boidinii]|nr:hypothetical protein BVG19_g361 [[Candida] boidinii]OWB49550.1 hypothetical protein B5S27_g1091 [[Candida] boidinii]
MAGKDSGGGNESSKSPKFLKLFKKSKDSSDPPDTSMNSENGNHHNKRMSNSSFNSNTSSIFRHKSSNSKQKKNRNSLNSDLTISSSKSFNNGSSILNRGMIPKSTSAPNIDHKLGLELPTITPIRSGSRGATKLSSTARKLKHKIKGEDTDSNDDDDDDSDNDDDGNGINHFVEDDDDAAYDYEDDDDDAEFNAQTRVMAGNEGNHILPISSATNALKNFTNHSSHSPHNNNNNTNGSLINSFHSKSNHSLKNKDKDNSSSDGLSNNKLQQKHSLHIPKFIVSHADTVSERDSNQTDKQNPLKNSNTIDSIDKTLNSSDTTSSNVNQNSSTSNINSIHNANSTNDLKDNNAQAETSQNSTGFISGLLNKLGSIGSPADESSTSGNNNNGSQGLLSSVLSSVTNHNNNSSANVNNALTTSSLLINGDQQTEEGEKFTLVSDSTTAGLSNVGLHSAENISFQPVRQSLLSTLGQGGLSLDAFPSQEEQNDGIDDAGDLLMFSSRNGIQTPQINIDESNVESSAPLSSLTQSNADTNWNADTNGTPLLIPNETSTPENHLSEFASRNRDSSNGNGGLSRYGQMNRSRATITESNRLDTNGSNSSVLLNKRYSSSSHTINVANMDLNGGAGGAGAGAVTGAGAGGAATTGGYTIPNSDTSNTLNSHLTTSTATTGNYSVTPMIKSRSAAGINPNHPQFNTNGSNVNVLQPNNISLDEQLKNTSPVFHRVDDNDGSGISSPPLSHPQPKPFTSGQHIQLPESTDDNDDNGRVSRVRHRGASILSSFDFSRTLSPFNEFRKTLTSPVMSRSASPVPARQGDENSDDDDEGRSDTEQKSPDVFGAATQMLHSMSVATTGRRKNAIKRLSAPQSDLIKSNRQSLEDGNGNELRKYFSNVTIDHTGTDKQDRVNNKMEYLSNKLNVKLPSSKRADSFKEVFEDMPYDEILIDDFACAYKKDILIQGRMYVTDKHICFHSKIIGLVKHFAIPFSKILEIKKKKTVGIPNALEFVTFHDKYSFASIINRDSAYDLIDKIWKSNTTIASIDSVHLAREDIEDDDNISEMESYLDDDDDDDNDGGNNKLTKVSSGVSDINDNKNGNVGGNSIDMDTDSSISDEENMIKDIGGDDEKGDGGKDDSKEEAADVFNSIKFKGPKQHAPTKNGYSPDSSDIKVIDDSIDAPLGVVFGLLFGDDTSMLGKIIKLQKNIDISDIPKFDSSTQSRNYSYVKPLNAPIGPKQTKCLINESIKKADFEESCHVLQTIETPDVPSGNAFKVLTKFYLSWGPNNSTKILIMTQVVWTGKSWIKGPVEKGSISGQQEALPILVNEIKKKIAEGTPKRKPSSSTRPKIKHKKSKKSAKPAVEEEVPIPDVVAAPAKNNNGIIDIILDFFTSIFNIIKSSLEMVNTMIPGPDYIKLSVEICLILYVTIKVLIFFASFISFGSSRNGPVYGGYNDYGYAGGYGYNYRNAPNRMFGNEYLLDRSEYDIWEWIDKRNAAYNDGYQGHHTSSGSNVVRDPAGEASTTGARDSGRSISNTKSNQEVEEMIALLEMRLAKLRDRLV